MMEWWLVIPSFAQTLRVWNHFLMIGWTVVWRKGMSPDTKIPSTVTDNKLYFTFWDVVLTHPEEDNTSDLFIEVERVEYWLMIQFADYIKTKEEIVVSDSGYSQLEIENLLQQIEINAQDALLSDAVA